MQKIISKLLILLSIVIISVAFLLCPAIAQQDLYMLSVETDADITLYGYVDGTSVSVYDSADNLIWEGVLEETVEEFKPKIITVPAGIYKCIGDSSEATFGVTPGVFYPEEDQLN